MAYSYSDVERANQKWFAADMTRQSLTRIQLAEGQIRGLSTCSIDFRYPISAIAGRNGSGKTTILALAACAFHNSGKKFLPTGQQRPYYTFSDFFIQAADEVSPTGIEIRYFIASNQWEKDEETPNGIGIAMQICRKAKGGRWSDYYTRIERPVFYFGIDRVVPHAEKSVYKSYRHHFASGDNTGLETEVSASVARILGNSYDAFQLRSHNNYRLPFVTRGGVKYSGFNMGAGEKALFEIFTAIHGSPDGTLFVVDEIELGLHEQAQRNLVRELNDITAKKHIQVICTTHSSAVLESLPPKGRFLIERYGDSCTILPEVTPAFATGRLSGIKESELHIYVEDTFAAKLLTATLAMQIRERIRIVPIGSVNTVVHQMCARFREQNLGEVLAIVDGDYQAKLPELRSQFLKQHSSSDSAVAWIEKRMIALPTNDTPPETFVLQRVSSSAALDALALQLGCTLQHLRWAIDSAQLVDPHDAFFSLSKTLHQSPDHLETLFCNHLGLTDQATFLSVTAAIESALNS